MRAEVARQSVWALAGSLCTLTVQTATTACLARWLAPEAFGLVALIAMLGTLASVLSQLGLGAALVQDAQVERRDVEALLGLWLAVGAALAGAFALVGPAFGMLFDSPELPELLAVHALTLVLGAPTGVAFALLQRRLAFGTLARLQVAGVLLNGGFAVTLAALGLGVWAVVAGRLLADTLLVVPALRVARAPIRPRMDRTRNRRFLRFGAPVTGAQLLIGIAAHADTAILGALAGTAALGHYSIAFSLAMLPASRLGAVGKRVAFSALSRAAESASPGAGAAFQRSALSLLMHLSALCTPLVLGLACVAPDAIALLLGPGWEETARLVALLAPAGLVGALGSGMGAIVLARGFPSVELGFAALRALVLSALIAVGVVFAGASGAALAVSGYNLLAFPLFFVVLRRWGGLRARDVANAIAPGVAASLAMLLPVAAARGALENAPIAVRLGAAVATGALAYALCLRVAFPGAWRELRQTATGLFARGASRLRAPVAADVAKAEGRA